MQTITIGRNSDNNVPLNYPQISKYHAKITHLGQLSFKLEDLESSNGTFVNNQQVTRTTISPTDQIKFANISFDLHKYLHLFGLTGTQQQTPPQASQQAPPPSLDFTVDFEKLRNVYADYRAAQANIRKKEKMQNAALGLIGGLAALLGAVNLYFELMDKKILGMIVVPLMLLSVAGRFFIGSEKKLADLYDQFRAKYVCPKCKNHLGEYTYEALAARKVCGCKAIWVK